MPSNSASSKKPKKPRTQKTPLPENESNTPKIIAAKPIMNKPNAISKKSITKILVLAGIAVLALVLGFQMTVMIKAMTDKQYALVLETTYGTREDRSSKEFFNGSRVLRTDGMNRLYLVDPDLKKILVWDTNEKTLVMSIDHARVEEKAYNPGDVAGDQQGHIYVLDNGKNQIIRLSAEGKREHHWPALHYRSIAMLPNGTLAALDAGKHQVVISDMNGKELRRFGKKGEKKGQFVGPLRLTTDAQSRIIVLDAKLKRVQIFSVKGKLLYVWPIDFTPLNITPIEVYGDQIVSVDYRNNKICFYSYKGKLKKTVARLYPGTFTVDSKQRIYMPYAKGLGSYVLKEQ